MKRAKKPRTCKKCKESEKQLARQALQIGHLRGTLERIKLLAVDAQCDQVRARWAEGGL